jgi:predicted Fe-Mo cluster-binding NifX family protein
MQLVVAFSTNDGETLVTDDHAGMARYFHVYRFTDGEVEFVERRENSKYGGDETMKHGDPEKAKKSLGALEGCDVWANPRFGPNLPRLLKKLLCVVVRVERVDEAVDLIRGNLEAVAEEHAKGEERQHLVLKPAS